MSVKVWTFEEHLDVRQQTTIVKGKQQYSLSRLFRLVNPVRTLKTPFLNKDSLRLRTHKQNSTNFPRIKNPQTKLHKLPANKDVNPLPQSMVRISPTPMSSSSPPMSPVLIGGGECRTKNWGLSPPPICTPNL